MTQVVPGVDAGGAPLQVRVHDLLLRLAGRLDDDALADARELLASAELDRSIELVAGCLAAGQIPVTSDEQRLLEALFDEARCDQDVVARLRVSDTLPAGRHKFAGGQVNGENAEDGFVEATRTVLRVLPDIRAVWCVWRLTPAGPASGPVPHRVVVIGVGPGGVAPATAYRVEHALRKAGIRASVEVLREGADPVDYHQDAMLHAQQVHLDQPQARELRAVASPPPPAPQPEPEHGSVSRREPEPPPAAWRSEPEPPVEPSMVHTEPEPEPQRPASVSWLPEPQAQETEHHAVAELDAPASQAPAMTDGESERLEPVAEPAPVESAPRPKYDDMLNDQERDLLRQLQEELARREQADADSGGWPTEQQPAVRPQLGWPAGTPSHMVNGMPPQHPDQQYPPAP